MEVELIPRSNEYARAHYGWRNEPEFLKHNPVEPIDYETFLTRLAVRSSDLSNLKAFNYYDWYITYRGQLVGNILLKEINHMMGFAEIGYGISQDYYGRGITSAALKLFIEKIFSETPLRKLYAQVHIENIGSCRVLEKNGFVKEGVLRKQFILNGRPSDQNYYGLLRDEWSATC